MKIFNYDTGERREGTVQGISGKEEWEGGDGVSDDGKMRVEPLQYLG